MSARSDFLWSLRREIWENRSIYIAPAAIGLLVLAGFLMHTSRWTEKLRMLEMLTPIKQVHAVFAPFSMAAAMVLLTTWLVGIFYSLDALHGERRDRSILFWKSMPVSDLVTVLAKAAVPLAVLPAVGIALALATQLVMVVASSAVLSAVGLSPSIPWSAVPWVHTTLGLAYGMATHALWFSPIFGYLLLVSAVARRAPFLWAFVPIFGAFALETISFGTTLVLDLIKYRVTGGMRAFKPEAMHEPITHLSQLDPMRFLATPGLWLGIAFAAACIAGAVRLRRYREPL